MALFFDQDWFNARLEDIGRTRSELAAHLGLSEQAIAEIWKDQRELLPNEVAAMARFLKVPAADVVKMAGAATPMPTEPDEIADLSAVLEKFDEMNGRIARLERSVNELKALILDLRDPSS